LVHFVRTNFGVSLMSKTDLHKAGRGSYDSKVNANTPLCIVRWYDNRAVHVSAIHADVHLLKTVKREDKTAQKFVKVQCPAAVPSIMLTWEALTCLARIDHKSVKWYRRIFYWALNVASINIWILYKWQCTQLVVPEF